MLPRIVLFVLQLAIAWSCADWIVGTVSRTLGLTREYQVLVYAAVYAVIVWLVGLAGGSVLKEIRPPSTANLAICLGLAFGFAILALIPQVRDAIESIIPALRANRHVYPLAGALLGFYVRR